jgi:hypothetical protein
MKKTEAKKSRATVPLRRLYNLESFSKLIVHIATSLDVYLTLLCFSEQNGETLPSDKTKQ